MPKGPSKEDDRPLVDRTLDRIRNNPVAAVIILVAIGIGSLASLTDSIGRLRSALPSFSSDSITGEWKSGPADFYPAGPEFMRLHLQEANGEVLGFVQLSGNDSMQPRRFDILDGKRDGANVVFSFDSGARSIDTHGESTPLRESLSGEIDGEQLRLVYRRQNKGGIAVTARPIAQAEQLIEGRLAIVYKGREYPDYSAGCTQLLSELNPSQIYKASEAPDEEGNVHCVGELADGSDGFDQYMNEVRQRIVCPPASRETIVVDETRASRKYCECDGELIAAANQCLSPPSR